MQRSTRTFTVLLALIVGASCWAVPYFQENSKNSGDQQKQTDKNKNKKSDKDKDKDKDKNNKDESPFGAGKINLLHSSHTSDTASAGFNGLTGLTPSGEVEAKKLKEPATGDDFNKAEQVSFIGVKASSLKKFIQEGKLNTAPAKTETASPKKS
ncbi:MAG TPA: hypothetical protein VK738_10950 [Terriglobales bacterium]|jgi:hypothetical protein|nr:hypothetical protein [Terriglobales bacterium]